MTWGKKQIAGVVYDLGHLDPFMMEARPKAEGAPTYKVRVTFGCHTFTRDLVNGDTPDLHFRAGHELRCFCTERHKLSLDLPEMIQYAAGGRVYFSERSNFLVVEMSPGGNAPYVAYFNLEKAKADDHDVAMFVSSAHLKPALPDRLPAVTFSTLVDYKFQGKPLTRPEPRKILMIKRNSPRRGYSRG